MNLAIIQAGGKQYLVKPNDKIQIEKIEGNVGDSIKLGEVLLTVDGDKINFGKPMIASGAVEAKILKQGRGKKVLVFKYKSKSKYRRKQGHRQAYTEIEIVKI